MSLPGMVRTLTSPDGLFDVVLVVIVVLSALVGLLAAAIAFGYLPPLEQFA